MLAIVCVLACPTQRQAEAAYSKVVLDSAPIAYWKLDESGGSTAINSGSLGSAANASYSGGHAKGAPPLAGEEGASVSFSGGRIGLGNVNGVNRSGPFTQKTIELWFQAESLSGRQVLYEQGGSIRGLSIYLDGTDLYVAGWNQANDDGGGGAAPWGAPNPVFIPVYGGVTTGAVYHVVLVMRGDDSDLSGVLIGYLNGASFGQRSGVGRLWNHNPAVIAGAAADTRFHDGNTNSNAREFDGRVDEVALYNRALTQAEVLAHFQAGSPAEALAGHWKFDEGIGLTAADGSTAGNDAKLWGSAAWTTDCLGRNAVAFDGVRGEAATTAPFSPPSTGTVAFWMKSAAVPRSIGRLFGVNGDWEARRQTDGTIVFDLGASPPSNAQPFRTTSAFETAGRWRHVAAVFDASDSSFEVWVDGELEASGVNSAKMVAQPSGTLSFGARTGSSERWQGAMRDFRVYPAKLSSARIAQLYGLVAHWKLDETSGPDAVDSSGRGADAEFVGTPRLGRDGAFSPKTGAAVQLDGLDDAIDSGQGLLNGADEFTMAGWIKPRNMAPGQPFFGQPGLIEVGVLDTAYRVELRTRAAGSVAASNVLFPGEWKHLAAVGTGDSLTLYVDGREVASGGSRVAGYGANAEAFKIGEGVIEDAAAFFDGMVDDVRLYHRALCPDQVYDLYKGGRPSGVRIIRWSEVR
ncbi:hypothetical protein Pla175_28470 [Pirellulimonas nuda]|uniref:LamG-like jellyroll fold domain-containing protein n=1 Tax=Pirellulimonas nuda TaxID=2528009 RepID=A0A518DDA1_9BACT|nr:LamG domain-containing protein [Pirellulimonas nuda]QDU89457.1 hypothetical protein Pla175_28470 [Pirellulimonas nuda]